MNFSLIRALRILLFPFSLTYGFIITVRNIFYDKKIIKSFSFDLPIINVGNLSLGGTGKTPMVEYLLRLLKDRYNVATLSRGYKRKSKGFLIAAGQSTAEEIGDEPMQFHEKFPEVIVAVGEERITAIPKLLQEHSETNLIILDDAFQHRTIKAGFNILLTAYNDLFIDDFFFPTGNLRDQRSSSQRADVIVVTKCPENLSEDERERVRNKVNPLQHQQVFFTAVNYGIPYHIITKEERIINLSDKVLLLCGIANPAPLKRYLSSKASACDIITFPNHHSFISKDIALIKRKLNNNDTTNKNNNDTTNKIIITTEKDAVRLIKFALEWQRLAVFVIPMQHEFLFGEGIQFDTSVTTFIEKFAREEKYE